MGIPGADEAADGGGRGVKEIDPVLGDDLPEAVGSREVGRAFVHHRRCAGGQRAVDDVAVPGDPADVGRAPVDVLLAQVEHPLHRRLYLHQVPGGGVHHPLGLAGGAAGVEDVERVLAVHRHGGAVGGGGGHQLAPFQVAAG